MMKIDKFIYLNKFPTLQFFNFKYFSSDITYQAIFSYVNAWDSEVSFH